MRQIKFRGKSVYGEWYYGLLSHSTVVRGHTVPEGWYISNKAGMPWAYHVRPESIGQFTGLTDKNEKEVYEGDICKGPNGKHWIIEWRGYSWCMTNETIPNGPMKFGGTETYTLDCWLMLPPSKQMLEVIGNIYEHPTLITNTLKG